MTDTTEHPTPETLDTFIAGGLPAGDHSAVDAHLATCPACSATVKEAATADRAMQTALASAGPDGGFDDRLIAAVRAAALPRPAFRLHPAVRRAAVAAAAVLVVGGVGYLGAAGMNGAFDWRSANRFPSASNLHQIGQAIILYDGGNGHAGGGTEKWDFTGGSDPSKNWGDFGSTRPEAKLEGTRNYGVRPAADGKFDYGANNPFGESAHDNGQTGRPLFSGGSVDKSTGSSPYDGQDSTLLPNANGDAAPGSTTPRPLLPPMSDKLANGLTGGRDKFRDEWTKQLIDSEEKKVPYTNILQYSPDWPQLSKMRDDEVRQEQGEGDATRTFGPGNGEGRQTQVAAAPPAPPRFRPLAVGAIPTADKLPVYVDATVHGSAPGGTGSAANGGQDAAGTNKGLSEAFANEFKQGNRGEAAYTFKGPDKADMLGGADLTQTPVAAAPTPLATQPVAIDTRKIIRTGSMEFEVDRFDSAQATIGKIVGEAGGFVGTTESQKLPNGKTRGTITLRVLPERLDALVLSLRALGDLKSQQISAADITKEYTDLKSELAADRAMQDRLLDLIKNGKGSIKDLLAAETELSTWRAKIEKAEGQRRYFDGQIALSTLTITLTERDIQTPAAAYETEHADMGIEADDVEKARDAALKAVDDVKGRVIQAELKRLDAGQLQALLVVDVPPESAGATIDRLKQLGRVARLAVDRQTVNADGAVMNGTNITSPVKTERRPTRLAVSIYNLANVAARRTTTINLAADDVETAYTSALAAAKDGGGKIIVSSLDGGDPINASATVSVELPPAKYEATLAALRGQGEVIKLSSAENPDTANTTDAKQGIVLSIRSIASIPCRETVGLRLAVVDVRSAYGQLMAAATAAKARVITGGLNMPDKQGHQERTATIELDVPRSQWMTFQTTVAGAGEIIDRAAERSSDAVQTTDAKIRVGLTLQPADKTAPRETTRIRVEVPDVDKAAADAQAMAVAHPGGRVIDATVSNEHDKGLSRVVMDVPLASGSDVVRQLRLMGTVRGIDAVRDSQAPAGSLAHAVVSVEFVTADTIVADTNGPGASIKQGLTTAVRGLMISLQWIVVGLCLLGPWALVAWIGWKLWKRRSRTPVAKV